MKTILFKLSPEVAGELGPQTLITNLDKISSGTEKILNISILEYEFFGWLGDCILTSHPCFIVTEEIESQFIYNQLTGFSFQSVIISKSDFFNEVYSSINLPNFKQLIINGTVILNDDSVVTAWSGHDVCVSENYELVITERCLSILKNSQLNFCEITELKFK